MKFELVEYHRNISKAEIIADLHRVAKELSVSTLTKKQYDSIGKYNSDTIAKKFDGWSNALTACGMTPRKVSTKLRYKNASREELLFDLIRVNHIVGNNTITCTLYALHGKYDRNSFTHEFGSWNSALKAAGLTETGYHRNVTKEELLSEIEKMWGSLGRQPTINDVKSGFSKYGQKTYYRVFGSWSNALKCFIEYENDPSTENMYVDSNSFDEKLQVDEPYTHSTRRDISLRLRFLVMKRDSFKCCICGASPAKDPNIELHIDHIIPWAKGGETVFNNLQTLCSNCNLGKSDLL